MSFALTLIIVCISDELYVTRIIEDATGKVMRESKPTSRSRVERIEEGMSINLDHEHYSIDVVPESESHWPEMRRKQGARDMIHWANDYQSQTACQISYDASPERSKDFSMVTCPDCKVFVGMALEDLLVTVDSLEGKEEGGRSRPLP